MRSFFDGMQIKTKLVMIIVITSLAALLIQAAGFIIYERMRVKEELVRDLSSLARIVADRSTAALIFNDDKVAIETLGALKVKRPITAACLYDAEGKVFARYDSGEERAFGFPALQAGGSQADVVDGYLHLRAGDGRRHGHRHGVHPRQLPGARPAGGTSCSLPA
jgi:hypothetical protein